MFNNDQQVNFYLQEFQPEVITLPLAQILALLISLTTAIAGFSGWIDWQKNQQQQTLLNQQQIQQQLQSELAVLEKSYKPIPIDRKLKQRIQELENTLGNKSLIQDYLQQQQEKMDYSFTRILSSLADSHIPGIWLTQITILSSDNYYGISGNTRDASLLPVYMQALQKQNALSGSGFTVMNIDYDVDDESLLYFTLGRSKDELNKSSNEDAAL
ncbi:MAG: hypothetical protein HRU20_08470 [Pseudomonadales bacterium]|nr:hypothetical protein [Pseudomonadales bacterium]